MTKILAFVLLCFVVGALSQVSPSPTNSNSYSNTNSYSNSYTNTNSGSNSNSNSNSYTNSNTNSNTNSGSNSYSPSGSYSLSVTNSYSVSPSYSPSYSTSYSTSTNSYTPPQGFSDKLRRPQNFQCKYANPNLYCRWTPGQLPYKRIRLQVICNSTNTFNVQGSSIPKYEYYGVFNSSTPRYQRITSLASQNQQRTIVSLDLPPNMLCQGVLAVRMFPRFRPSGIKYNDNVGVVYDLSRLWFKGKTTAGVFLTAPSNVAF